MVTTECTGSWYERAFREDGEGGVMVEMACTGCKAKMWIANGKKIRELDEEGRVKA